MAGRDYGADDLRGWQGSGLGECVQCGAGCVADSGGLAVVRGASSGTWRLRYGEGG